MYRGRFQLGEEVPLTVGCRNSSGAPAAPDAAPTMTVYDGAGARVSGYSDKPVPAMDRYATTGLFAFNLLLGARFTTGRYHVVYNWVIGPFTGKSLQCFDIIPGGNAKGAVIAMHNFERPHARFLVQHLDSGALVSGRNPSI